VPRKKGRNNLKRSLPFERVGKIKEFKERTSAEAVVMSTGGKSDKG